jgi:hypothetical protein
VPGSSALTSESVFNASALLPYLKRADPIGMSRTVARDICARLPDLHRRPSQ